ncbi:MAG TPA: hypothetical protein DCR21_02845, partial [Succinivibrionaceae bacterium]|nr:hypothetical protein [Succinivibrionaceae bacterium]
MSAPVPVDFELTEDRIIKVRVPRELEPVCRLFPSCMWDGAGRCFCYPYRDDIYAGLLDIFSDSHSQMLLQMFTLISYPTVTSQAQIEALVSKLRLKVKELRSKPMPKTEQESAPETVIEPEYCCSEKEPLIMPDDVLELLGGVRDDTPFDYSIPLPEDDAPEQTPWMQERLRRQQKTTVQTANYQTNCAPVPTNQPFAQGSQGGFSRGSGEEPSRETPQHFFVHSPAVDSAGTLQQESLPKVQGHIEIDRQAQLFLVFAEFKYRDICRSIRGGRWDPLRKCWLYPFTQEVAYRLMQVFPDYPLPSNDFESEINAIKAESIQKSVSLDASFKVRGLGGELLPYQRAGVAYASEKRRCFIADEMGLGKTVQALATVQALQAYPAVIVCPTVVKLNWKIEAEKWLPGRRVHVINGTGKNVSDKDRQAYAEADLVVINYEIVKHHLPALEQKRFASLVMDESHYVKGYQSQRTKAVTALSRNIPVRLALSGTPLLNRPQELIAQLKILDRLDDLGGFSFFTTRYCGAHRTNFGLDLSGATHLDELNRRLRECCYVRRKKNDVLTELPAKRISKVFFDLTPAARKAYNTAFNDLAEFLIRYKNCTDEELERKLSAERLVQIETLKQVAVEGKFKQACEWIDNFLQSGEKLIFFCTHAEIISRLNEVFPNAVIITGATSQAGRQQVVERFQNDPSVSLALLQLKAAGVGITLTASSNVAFLEMGWTPADHAQAEDRAHRLGQKNQVNCYYLLAKDTIDEDIHALIENKRKVFNAAADGGDEKIRRKDTR